MKRNQRHILRVLSAAKFGGIKELSAKQIGLVLSDLNWWEITKYSVAANLGYLHKDGLVKQKKHYYGKRYYPYGRHRFGVQAHYSTWRITLEGLYELAQITA